MDAYTNHFADLMGETSAKQCGSEKEPNRLADCPVGSALNIDGERSETGISSTSPLRETGMGSRVDKPAPLHGVERNPMYTLQREKFEHRIVAFHKAAGLTDKECAEATGLHPVTIGYIKKQPWFEQAVLEQIHQRGNEVLNYLQEQALDSAKRLVDIARQAENDETRRKANNDVLDRVFGKPNSPITVSNVKPSDVSDAELVAALKN